jgi:hypothetical protein
VWLAAEPAVATSLAEYPVLPQRAVDSANHRDAVLEDLAALAALEAHVHVLARVLGDTICANVPKKRTRGTGPVERARLWMTVPVGNEMEREDIPRLDGHGAEHRNRVRRARLRYAAHDGSCVVGRCGGVTHGERVH